MCRFASLLALCAVAWPAGPRPGCWVLTRCGAPPCVACSLAALAQVQQQCVAAKLVCVHCSSAHTSTSPCRDAKDCCVAASVFTKGYTADAWRAWGCWCCRRECCHAWCLRCVCVCVCRSSVCVYVLMWASLAEPAPGVSERSGNLRGAPATSTAALDCLATKASSVIWAGLHCGGLH